MLFLLLLLFLCLAAAFGCEWLFCLLGGRAASPLRLLCGRRSVFRGLWFSAATLLSVVLLNGNIAALTHLSLLRFLTGLGVLLALAGGCLLFAFYRQARRGGRVGALLALCLLLTVALEAFFNFRAIGSAEYQPTDLSPYLAGVTGAREADGEPGVYRLYGSGVVFEYTDLDLDIKNLCIDAVALDERGRPADIRVEFRVADEGNAFYYSLTGRTLYGGDASSRTIPLQAAGKVEKLSLSLSVPEDTLTLCSVTANTPKPLRLSPMRMAAVFAILLCIVALRPSSSLYKFKLGEWKLPQTLITAAVILLNFALIFAVVACGTYFTSLMSAHHDQYQKLAEQLLAGRVTYPGAAPDFLSQIENPYDPALRAEAGQYYVWDVAYYNGNYYVYFGVVPVLLAYIPYHLLTGGALPNDMAVLAFCALFLVAVFVLLYRMIRRHFPATPYLVYLLLSLLVANGAGLFTLITYPSLYSVPIAAGLALSACGLSLWYGALGRERLSAWRLLLGSLCMALVAGCRPQMLLLSLLALPLFYDALLRQRTLLPTSRRGALNFLCFTLPYFVVAAGLMAYNYVRFGSPFDFGANYNLTTNDMTLRGFRFDRIGLAVYQYLVQLPKYISRYPFIRNSDLDTSYMGTTIWEYTYGGLFAIAPFTLFSLLLLRMRHALARRRLLAPAAIFLGVGIFVAMADAQLAGILLRYFADFSLPVFLSAALVFLTLLERARGRRRRALLSAGGWCLAATALHDAALVFSAGFLTMPDGLITALQFWL